MTNPIPDNYFLLPAGWLVMRGDFWCRPYDGVWVETGKYHWGMTCYKKGDYARRENEFGYFNTPGDWHEGFWT